MKMNKAVTAFVLRLLLVHSLRLVLASFFLLQPAMAETKPNIVLILTDDQDLATLEHMPQVNKLLVNKGMKFLNAFVVDSVCCPSRVSILRGQYSHSHGVLSNLPPLGGFPRLYEFGLERSTVATWLKRAGYRTGYFGKYMNRYPDGAPSTYIPPGWGEWHAGIGDSALHSMYGYQMNENGVIVSYGSTDADYLTDVLAGKAVKFIEASGSKPFFLYVGVTAPHLPAVAATRHQKEFAGIEVPKPPSFNEEYVGDKPAWVRAHERFGEDRAKDLSGGYRKRLRTLLAVDELIRDVVAALEKKGVLDETFIVFTSDNGYKLGQHRMTDKGSAYEEDIRVPLVVRGPGVPRALVSKRIVLNTDLAPTFAELGEAAIPSFVEGRSLVPILAGQRPAKWRRRFLLEHLERTDVPTYDALRTKTETYVEYENGEREYYDLSFDPYQLHSIPMARFPSRISLLSSLLKRLKNCSGAACREIEE